MSVQVKFRLVRTRLEQDGFSLAQIKDAMNSVELDMDELASMEAGGSNAEDLANHCADQMKAYLDAQ